MTSLCNTAGNAVLVKKIVMFVQPNKAGEMAQQHTRLEALCVCLSHRHLCEWRKGRYGIVSFHIVLHCGNGLFHFTSQWDAALQWHHAGQRL